MSEPKVLDFDRARSERRTSRTLRAFGQEHPIPSSPPYGFVMESRRIQQRRGDGHDFTPEEMTVLLELAVGTDTFTALQGGGLEMADLEILLEMLMDAWGEGDDSEGEAQAPETTGASSTT